jgi:hypothetical protein
VGLWGDKAHRKKLKTPLRKRAIKMPSDHPGATYEAPGTNQGGRASANPHGERRLVRHPRHAGGGKGRGGGVLAVARGFCWLLARAITTPHCAASSAVKTNRKPPSPPGGYAHGLHRFQGPLPVLCSGTPACFFEATSRPLGH